jgi:hypothetical protein
MHHRSIILLPVHGRLRHSPRGRRPKRPEPNAKSRLPTTVENGMVYVQRPSVHISSLAHAPQSPSSISNSSSSAAKTSLQTTTSGMAAPSLVSLPPSPRTTGKPKSQTSSTSPSPHCSAQPPPSRSRPASTSEARPPTRTTTSSGSSRRPSRPRCAASATQSRCGPRRTRPSRCSGWACSSA